MDESGSLAAMIRRLVLAGSVFLLAVPVQCVRGFGQLQKFRPPSRLTPSLRTATTKSAAPVTDTVRTAGRKVGNVSQRGQFPAAPPGAVIRV